MADIPVFSIRPSNIQEIFFCVLLQQRQGNVLCENKLIMSFLYKLIKLKIEQLMYQFSTRLMTSRKVLRIIISQ